MSDVKIHPSWKQALADIFEQDYFKNVTDFVKREIQSGQTIYPHPRSIFAAFDLTPLDDVKVVIIGQDPYHGPRQAHGLCFSVNKDVKIPPSLQNIYKELNTDIGMQIPHHGDLTSWARQWVLLLNATLTVRAGQPTSHSWEGWEEFTDAVITKISDEKSWVIFLLWWAYAQKKSELIDWTKHQILESTHPSPFSANKGFLGCRHFSKVNEILRQQGKEEIDWASVLDGENM